MLLVSGSEKLSWWLTEVLPAKGGCYPVMAGLGMEN